MKEITNQDLFYCYNKKLADHLYSLGLKPLTIAINPNSNSMYSLFAKSNELQEALRQYHENRK